MPNSAACVANVQLFLINMFKLSTNFHKLAGANGFFAVFLLLLLGTVSLSVPAYSQDRVISGTVVTERGEAVAGAAIMIPGTTVGTIADANGQFSLKIASGVPQKLEISFIGYETLTLSIEGKTELKVTLKEIATELDDVVVVGYGTMRKKDLTGAIGNVGGAIIESRKTNQISTALQGTLPGVTVTRSSSAPGADATIRVRGITSMKDSSPLVIIDGAPSAIGDVNPADVESISVLKDASSAAIYGARAAAGVILITTKRAREGQPTTVDYSYSLSMDYPTAMPEYEGAVGYMRAQNEQMYNDNPAVGLHSVYSQNEIDNYAQLHAQNPDLYPDTDWVGMILKKKALRHSHALSVTAASKAVRTKISLGYDNVDGLYKKNLSWKRYNVRVNNDIRVAKWLNVSLDLNLRKQKSINPYYSPSGTMRYMPPTFPAMWSDGRIASGKEGVNPYGKMMEGGTKQGETWLANGKLQVEIAPVKGLKITGTFIPKYIFGKDKDFNIAAGYTPWDEPDAAKSYLVGATTTDLKESRSDTYSHTTQLFVNYDADLGRKQNHHLSVMAGVEDYYKRSENIYASRDQFKISYYPYLSMGSTEFQGAGVNSSPYENSYISVFGRINYNYKYKYYVQANFRADGSGRFKKGNRWGFFPSVSAGWVLTQEDFMEGARDVLSFFKIRASYGQLGNDRIGNYPYQTTLSSSSAAGYLGTSGAVQALQGFAAGQMTIDDITWETTETYDIGLDMNFFKDRLRFSGDFYKKTTRDMLILVDIPSYMGYEKPYKNSGDMHTTGWDLSLSWSDAVADSDFTYGISFNISDYKSMMGYIGNDYQLSGDKIIQSYTEYQAWYGYRSNGLFQTLEQIKTEPKVSASNQPGDIRYVDISGKEGEPDGTISATYDRTVIGSSLPRFNFGGSISFGYKGIDLSCTFQGVGKRDALLSEEMVQPLRTGWYNVPKFVVNNHWSVFNTIEQNTKVKYPRYSVNSGSNTVNYDASDFWLIDGSYFRIKDITLGYTLPHKWMNRIYVKDLRFAVSLSDFFTFSHFPKGWDPEVGSTGYPITKSVVFTASIKF